MMDGCNGTPARIGGLTKALVVLSIIGVAASAVALLVQLVLRDKAIDYLNRDISKTKFRDDLTPYLAAIFVAGVVLFAALVVQIIWAFRMAKNLRALGRPSQSFSPGVTIAINILGGCTLGILPHLAVSVTGLAALLAASPVAFRIVTYLGVAYLLYMAVATLRDRDALVVAGDGEPKPAARVVLDGVLVNLLNPKLTMFFVAFLPQFVDPTRPGSTARMLVLGGVFMLATFAVFAAYAVIAAAVRERVVTRPRVLRWLRRVFAVSFVALGARLALAAR